MLTVKLKQSECWNHYINDQSALNEIFLFLSTHSPIKIHVNVHIPWQAGERRGEGVQGAHGGTAGGWGGGGGYRSRTDSSRSSFDRRCACVKLETWLLCWNRVLGRQSSPHISWLLTARPSSLSAPSLSRLVISVLILYAKQGWLVRSLSLLGVLISEYFQHHKWISSVLPSLLPLKNTLKASKFCIEMRGARLDKKPWYEWHCHYKMFVYWWLSH